MAPEQMPFAQQRVMAHSHFAKKESDRVACFHSPDKLVSFDEGMHGLGIQAVGVEGGFSQAASRSSPVLAFPSSRR